MMNRLLIRIFLFIAAIVSLTSCGSDDSFRISGEVNGLGTRNLRFYYYDGRTLKVGMSSALDGKFNFIGSTRVPALVTIATAQRQILGRVVVENGDAVDVKLDIANPYFMEVEGNKASMEYASFLRDNATVLNGDDPTAINKMIAGMVEGNKSRLSSTLALLLHYEYRDDAAMADSLLMMIDPEARPQQFIAGYRAMLERFTVENSDDKVEPMRMFCDKDSLTTFNPSHSRRSLLVFTRGTSARRDSINAAVDSIAPKKNDSRLAVVNISLDNDTSTWKETLRDAPARGLNLWAPGAVSSVHLRQFDINRLPLFVVTDSTGTRLYQGLSLTDALKEL